LNASAAATGFEGNTNDMTAPVAETELQPLTGYEPESSSGVRIFRAVRARGSDIIDWANNNPGALNSSTWHDCDLDDTEWPGAMQDVVLVDCSLRNSRWHLTDAQNVSIRGSRRISMHYDSPANQIVVSLENVRARVDGMVMTGAVTGLSLLRVAGTGVTLGEPPKGFFDQEQLPLQFGGTPIRMDSSIIQLCYLERLTVYMDGEDVSIYKNGLPDFSFGGTGTRCDISRNVAP
jgi:hypothetical protein